ncbi:hypothetical protein, partial [Klebsiella pneumoniae]|uniref:hypothetical protein n=1 Tax=Klebsiella pneumoniae TaxID=573 RepID=UPI002730AF50
VNIKLCLVPNTEPTGRTICREVQEAFPLPRPQIKWANLLQPTAVCLLGEHRNNLARLADIKRMPALPIGGPLFFVNSAP